MPHLSPPTITEGEIRTILEASAGNIRDHLIYSLAVGTVSDLPKCWGGDLREVQVFRSRDASFAATSRFSAQP